MFKNIFSLTFWGALIGVIIYLIIQRIKEKKKEDFEDRDN